ncbi:hypothetical protein [Parasitella parasitica]|uniref:Uncharacterized protein n=1 Tax=Parasitella parasitica TaxID=35722 RepID=A0A0B7NBD0_9FUNG|nr:hypothetical protein [Parasitella parasitica]
MSTDEVTVSLSRLALAKAIKTPDAGENEAEPWTKSIIFHQPHIDAQMRSSILNPQSQQYNRRKNGRHGNHKQPLLKQHKYPQHQPLKQQHQKYPHSSARLVAPPMNRVLSDEMRQPTPSPPTQQQNRASYFPLQPQLQQRASSQSASSSSVDRSSLSSGKLAAHSKSNRKFVPSDDEDDEEDEETDDEDEDQDEVAKQDKEPAETGNHKMHAPKPSIMTPAPLASATSTLVNTSKNAKPASRLPQPSDDEESDQENDDVSDHSDDEDKKQEEDDDEQTYARRMSTLRRLERGPSLHRRTRSTGDMMMIPPAEAFVEPATAAIAAAPEGNKLGSIEQWRMTVMEADGISTPTSNESIRSRAAEDVSGEEGDMVEEPIVRSGSATSNANSHPPLPRQQTPIPDNGNRRSTIGEMDMFYYQQQQQQQHLYNMQLQHAMQMQQAQQMAQIQQYQAIQMQQQHQAQQYRKANNRKSVSAMDLMLKMEQDKAASRKTNKRKMPDPSKATLADGLLGRVPEPGQHIMNFQHHLMKQQMARASKSDYQIRQNAAGSSRPPSSMIMNNSNRRSQLIRSESSPIPTLSMSTPINQAYLIPPNQQQQMLMPPHTQMMHLNRSSQYLNINNNNNNSSSKRQSTYSSYNQF